MIGAITAGATAGAGGFPIRTGLYAWYDASVASSITSSATKVSQWNDLSGNGRHLTQATGALQPVTGTTTQNSKNVIVFDTQNINTATTSYGLTANALTIFFVAKKTAAGAAANNYSRVVSLNKDVGDDYATTDAISSFYSTASLGGYSPSSAIYRVNATIAAQALTYNQANTTAYRLNGTAVDLWQNATTASGTTSATAINSNKLALGSSWIGLSDGYLNGWIGEVLVYNTVMSNTDVTSTRDYLKTKWSTV